MMHDIKNKDRRQAGNKKLPYPHERAPTTECPPTHLFWLNFLLRSKVYALYIVRNLLHYNNDAAASYLVWNYVNMPVGCG